MILIRFSFNSWTFSFFLSNFCQPCFKLLHFCAGQFFWFVLVLVLHFFYYRNHICFRCSLVFRCIFFYFVLLSMCWYKMILKNPKLCNSSFHIDTFTFQSRRLMIYCKLYIFSQIKRRRTVFILTVKEVLCSQILLITRDFDMLTNNIHAVNNIILLCRTNVRKLDINIRSQLL